MTGVGSVFTGNYVSPTRSWCQMTDPEIRTPSLRPTTSDGRDDHHRRLHLSHLRNTNNNASFRISMDERSVFLLRMAKLLVLLFLLLMLL